MKLIFRVQMAASVAAGCMFGAPDLRAAELSYPLQLQTPKLESLSTSLSPTGGTVVVQIQVRYDAKGGIVCTGLVDNLAATCKGTLKTTPAGSAYKFSLRTATTPPSVVSLAGTVGQPLGLCSYSGPRGRFLSSSNAVSITATQPVPATLKFSPLTSDKNLIAGTAKMNAGYSPDLAIAGTVKGKVTSNSLSLQIKQDKRIALYNGQRQGSTYVGPLRVTIPPAKETFSNFALPVPDLPLASGSATFRGALMTISNQLPVPAVGAVVTVRTDLNGDGKFVGREILRTVANAQGRYELKAAVVRGRTVLLEIRSPGLADVLVSSESVLPGAVIVKNATLQPLGTLTVAGGRAEAKDGSILLDGLPDEIESVQGRVFNPRTEIGQFPGQFADNAGNKLISSVFAAIEATDGAGRLVTNLGSTATLCLKVPQDCWVTMGDLSPGNGKLDVPLYYYDEETGQWVRHSSDGWLEDAGHQVIAEDSLASIRNGSYVGEVFVAGKITHLSWWNLDWPVSTHAAIRGLIVDGDGHPIPGGASLTAVGLSYSGMSGPETVAEDGSFCVEIMRSEGTGEDLDRDGHDGETHQVQLKVQSGTNLYSFGPFASPVLASTCGTGSSNVGPLMLTAAAQLRPTNCLVSGQVVYSGIASGASPTNLAAGTGVRSTVVAFDPDALDAAASTCSNCLSTLTDPLGRFTLEVPIISGVTITAYATRQSSSGNGVFAGTMNVVGCPNGAVTVPVDYHDLGQFLVTFENSRGDFIGTGVVIGEAIQVTLYPSFPTLTPAYVGSRNSAGVPTQPGTWLSFPMGDVSNGFVYVGSITITITTLSPVGGTWKIEGGSARLSGRWSAAFSGE